MQIRRLAEGDEEAACQLIEQVKFVIEEAPDVSLDPADMGALLAHDRAYLLAAYVDDRPAWSTATASPASMGPGRSCFSMKPERSRSTAGGASAAPCASARLGGEEECRKWLERRRDLPDLPSRKHMETDPDLDRVRDKDWFKEILAAAPER